MKKCNWNNQLIIKAFTLAEVLITLGIIGVVAALTIPTLMNSASNIQYYTGLRKAQSILEQANMALIGENGSMLGAIQSYGSLTNALASKLKTTKICLANQNPGECFASTITNLPGGSGSEVIDYESKTPINMTG